MVLKRLATALGALGLGALAAGTALGQTAGEGNIPAPDIFDDQILCSMLVPSAMDVPAASMTLTTLIGMGNVEIDTTATGLGTYADLGYVIPPEGMNCGAGDMGPTLVSPGPTAMNADSNGDGDYNDVGDTLVWNSVPKDVADGYSELLGKYVAVYGNPGGTTGGTARELAAKQKALSDGLASGTSGVALTALQEDVTAAQEAHNKAMAEFRAASQGPIYQAGVAEWMAKAAVTKSVVDYNSQVVATNMAMTALDEMTYAGYVPLTNNALINDVFTFTGGMISDPMLGELTDYVNGDLGDPHVGTVAMGVTTTTDSNFDARGRLLVPMSLQDHDNDATTPNVLRPVTNTDGTANAIGGNTGIRETVRRFEAAAKALEKLRDENVNPTLAAVYTEAARRAREEANYYNTEWAEVLADTTDTRTDIQKLEFLDTDGDGTLQASERIEGNRNTAYVANPISIASRNAAHIAASNRRVAAEADLKEKVSARETATMFVQTQFADAQAFYAQLVARREALKVTADRAVADAETPTGAQRTAATNAQRALAAAQKAKEDLDMLFADENDPTVELIRTLTRTDGNDGQALVDAISSNYDTAREARMKADEVAESVMGLTGDEGQVSANTERIMQNEDDIGMLDGRVTKNEADIMTNADNIATNADNIMTNTTMIGENRGMIETNAGDIVTNAGNIAMNTTVIGENKAAIGMNTTAIDANKTAIGANRTSIMQNADMIGGLQDQMEVVRAGVAASMALAGMPAINGRGISIGVGSFDGESAFAVGFQIQSEMASFKVGVTSAGGETGASAGVGFQF